MKNAEKKSEKMKGKSKGIYRRGRGERVENTWRLWNEASLMNVQDDATCRRGSGRLGDVTID